MAGGEGRRPVQIPATIPAPIPAVLPGSTAAAMGAAAPPRRPRRSRLSGGGAGGGTSCAEPGRAGSGGSGRRSFDSSAPQARLLPVPGSVRVYRDRPWGRFVTGAGLALPSHTDLPALARPRPPVPPRGRQGCCWCSLGQGPPRPLAVPWGSALGVMQVALPGITPVVGEGG